MVFDVHVEIGRLDGIADPEGLTIERTAPALGFGGIAGADDETLTLLEPPLATASSRSWSPRVTPPWEPGPWPVPVPPVGNEPIEVRAPPGRPHRPERRCRPPGWSGCTRCW